MNTRSPTRAQRVLATLAVAGLTVGLAIVVAFLVARLDPTGGMEQLAHVVQGGMLGALAGLLIGLFVGYRRGLGINWVLATLTAILIAAWAYVFFIIRGGS